LLEHLKSEFSRYPICVPGSQRRLGDARDLTLLRDSLETSRTKISSRRRIIGNIKDY
jgi:hypothetical protein